MWGKRVPLAQLTVCPRCRGGIQPDDVTCGRCGLSLPSVVPARADATPASSTVTIAPSPPALTEEVFSPDTETQRLDYFPTQAIEQPTLIQEPPIARPSTPAIDEAQVAASPVSEQPSPSPDPQQTDTGELSRHMPPRSTGPVGSSTAPPYTASSADSVEAAAPSAYTGPLDQSTRANSNNTGGLTRTGALGNTGALTRTGPLNNTGPLGQTGPLNYSGPLVYTGPLTNTGPLAPKGALQLLPQEAIAYQMGALYLTNKRVILLAPTVVRSAFIRDIDAVGTLTERASAWNLFFGGLSVLLAIGAFWANGNRADVEKIFSPLYAHPLLPLGLTVLLGGVGLFMLARHFFWVKRSLFVSVKGRPLITVSMTDWNPRRLANMDGFVNAFFQIKDFLTGDLMERQLTGELSEWQVTGGLSERQLTGGLSERQVEP